MRHPNSNKVFILALLIMVYSSVSLSAQCNISGVVKNTEGAVVDFASVIATPSNAPKTVLSSGFTDENGQFPHGVSEGKTAANGCKNRRYNILIFS